MSCPGLRIQDSAARHALVSFGALINMKVVTSIVVFAAVLLTGVGVGNAAQVDARYPSLDKVQVGTVRHLVRLASQAEGDWTDMTRAKRAAFDDEQYQLAFMNYALAITQTQLVPAYRELYERATARNIEKMLSPDVWQPKWLHLISDPQYKKYLDPKVDWRDPVRDKNIMYSGHLLQMIGLYETLYGDAKYERPGSIIFTLKDDPAFSRSYNFTGLAQVIRAQYINSQFDGAQCEPNMIYSACQQHPILGLISYDKLHKTHLADVRGPFLKRALEQDMIKPSKRFSWPFQAAERHNFDLQIPANDGWTGLFMHAWQKDLVDQIYPAERTPSLDVLLSREPAKVKVYWAQVIASTGFSLFAAYTAEIGDQDARRKMIDYADSMFHPVWQNGEYFYPRHDPDLATVDLGAALRALAESSGGAIGQQQQTLRDDQLDERQVGPFTGNAGMALAILNPGNGLWSVYNNLAATYVAESPQLVGVSYPQVIVNQAFYSQTDRVLALGLLPGTADHGRTAFRVKNLKPRGTYDVIVDGSAAAKVEAGHVIVNQKDVGIAWTPGELQFELAIGDGRGILIEESESSKVAAR